MPHQHGAQNGISLFLFLMYFFSFLWNLLGVTLVNTTTQISGKQFYNPVLYPILYVPHPKSNLLPSSFLFSVQVKFTAPMRP